MNAITITVGNGRKNPRGTRVETDDLAATLAALDGAEAWWSPAVFRDDHRRNDGWQRQDVIALDVDYYDAHGQHAPFASGELRLEEAPATLVHLTPRGLRVVAALDAPLIDADAHARVMRAYADIVEAWLSTVSTLEPGCALRVDRKAVDRARFLWAPNTSVDDLVRRAPIALARTIVPPLAVLAAEPSNVVPLRRPRSTMRPPPPPRGGADLLSRARAYVERVDPSISGQGGDDQLFAAARAVAGWVQKGLPRVEGLDLLREYNGRCQPPWDDGRVAYKLEEALTEGHTLPALEDRDRSSGMRIRVPAPAAPDELELIQDNGAPAKTAGNVARMLALYPRGIPRLDRFTGHIVWPDGALLRDSDAYELQDWLYEQPADRRVRATEKALHGGLTLCAERNAFDSLVQYVEGLPAWDSVPRLDTWLSVYLGAADEPHTRRIGRAWLVSCLARALSPGCVADGVLTLEGAEGTGKNYAIATLFGAERVRGVGAHEIGSRDSLQIAAHTWVIHDDEFRGRGEKQRDKIFSWISSLREDVVRKYENHAVTLLRRAVLVVSLNRDGGYLERGENRRFWVVQTGVIDVPTLARDGEQLLAEALAAYRAGEQWTIGRSDPLWDALSESRAERVEESPVTQRVRAALVELEAPILMVTIMGKMGIPPERMNQSAKIIGRALRDLGWERSRAARDVPGRPWTWSARSAMVPDRSIQNHQ